jgi:hypothetical protein
MSGLICKYKKDGKRGTLPKNGLLKYVFKKWSKMFVFSNMAHIHEVNKLNVAFLFSAISE